MLATLSEIVISTRPWSFTAGIIPVVITAAIAGVPLTNVKVLSTVVMAVSIQAGANLTNTYFDFANGVDTKENGEKTLVERKLSPGFLFATSVVCYIIGIAIVFPMLIAHANSQLITVFSCGIVLAFFYTATPVGLKYHALGDVTIFLCFGPLLMQCTSLMISGEMRSDLFYYTIPIGLLTEAILHANNSRDIETDLRAGATTVAGLIGFEASRQVYNALIIGTYLSTIAISAQYHFGCLLALLTLPLGTGLMSKFYKKEMMGLEEETAKLHLPFGILMIIGILSTSKGFLAFV
ncbi:UbiA prenyltransferase family-domain-containing protein [Ochromonadaceae sp. CCMP2298]|nr:UbiA prenyltransferase family-domain-containing protein [Ochromonadaceae sp. CCMP2298]|mmetsp:Transcript_5471/g.12076  ORF Transcript_5471/g.12076 Transcript_5471/m.12076 type:complete len:294 (+) Transcript_5471:253-1134(+)